MRFLRFALSTVVASATLALTSTALTAAAPTPMTPTLKQCVKLVKSDVLHKGQFTLATDNPVYAPWFVNNDPANALGYEGALAYDVTSKLGFAPTAVNWVTEPFASSYTPGPKDFDFDINEIPYSTAKAQNVSFSTSYYEVSQSIVAMKSDPIVKHHTAKQLKTYVYGALAGTPAAAYVTAKIAPKAKVVTFAMLAPAVLALETGVIDALAIDTPTGNYLATTQLLANNGTQIATQVGQFASNGDEYYALLLQKSSPIAGCVDVALASLNNQGTIAHLQKLWLKVYATIPTIKP